MKDTRPTENALLDAIKICALSAQADRFPSPETLQFAQAADTLASALTTLRATAHTD